MIICAKEYERSLGNKIRNLKMTHKRHLLMNFFFPSSVSKTPNTHGQEESKLEEIVQELAQLKDQLCE